MKLKIPEPPVNSTVANQFSMTSKKDGNAAKKSATTGTNFRKLKGAAVAPTPTRHNKLNFGKVKPYLMQKPQIKKRNLPKSRQQQISIRNRK